MGEGGENDRVREEGQEERWGEDDPHSQNTHLSNAKLNFVLNFLWSIGLNPLTDRLLRLSLTLFFKYNLQ